MCEEGGGGRGREGGERSVLECRCGREKQVCGRPACMQ